MGFFLSLFIFASLFVLGELLRPKPNIEDAKPSGLGEFDFPTATEGRVIPLVWGTVRVSGPNVIWYGDFRQEAITERVKTGLFSSSRVTVGFRYRIGIQFAVCWGPVDFYRRVWVGDKVVFGSPIFNGTGQIQVNEPDLFGGEKLGNGGVVGDLDWFNGSATQAASSYLAPFQTVNSQQNAYRYLAYFAPSSEPTYVGNSTSIQPWAIEVQRLPRGRVPDPNDPTVTTQVLNASFSAIEAVPGQGIDANPVFVLFEIMTDIIWGLGRPADEFDVSSWNAAAQIIHAEENGFSFTQDTAGEVSNLIRLIEEQIDGVVFQDPRDGLWKINLTRADSSYTDVGLTVPALLPDLNGSNIIDLQNFARGSWDDTTNAVDLEYVDRSQNYSTKFGKAQDMANVRLQGGVSVKTTLRFPGVKTNVNANDLAWRELRTLAYPLAKATVIVDRSLWEAQPARIVRLSDEDLGISNLRMRVTEVDFSDLVDGRIRLELVEDVFSFSGGSFAAPPPSSWTPPADSLTPFPADAEAVLEAPRRFLFLDPLSTTDDNKVWCGARDSGPEVGFNIRARSGPSTPISGGFVEAGDSVAFMLVGRLSAALQQGAAYPQASIDLDLSGGGNIDSAAAIAAAFSEAASIEDMGLNLINLIMVGDTPATREFMLVTSAAAAGDTVTLSSVYRGVMDTPQRSHSLGDPVYLLFAGGSLTDDNYGPSEFVEVRLQPISSTDTVDEGLLTSTTLQMTNRPRRPYPPSLLAVNGTDWNPGTVSLDANSTGTDDSRGLEVDITRRDFLLEDEISQLGTDASSLDPAFPAANSTEHRMTVVNDPDGSPVTILTGLNFGSGTTFKVLRNAILAQTDGVVPSRLQVAIAARHTVSGSVLEARNALAFSFDVSSALSGLVNLGARAVNLASAAYTATEAGAFALALDTALPGSGVVEFRINAGAWATGIAAGATTGSAPGVAIGDTLEVRHVSTTGSTEQLLRLSGPTLGLVAYSVLTN